MKNLKKPDKQGFFFFAKTTCFLMKGNPKIKYNMEEKSMKSFGKEWMMIFAKLWKAYFEACKGYAIGFLAGTVMLVPIYLIIALVWTIVSRKKGGSFECV